MGRPAVMPRAAGHMDTMDPKARHLFDHNLQFLKMQSQVQDRHHNGWGKDQVVINRDVPNQDAAFDELLGPIQSFNTNYKMNPEISESLNMKPDVRKVSLDQGPGVWDGPSLPTPTSDTKGFEQVRDGPTHLYQPMETSQGSYPSERTPLSSRMGSTLSKESVMSSNTSAGLADPASEHYQTSILLSGGFRHSRSSSMSSQLSPARSVSPLKPISFTKSEEEKPSSKHARKKRRLNEFRARTSIPTDISPAVLAQQSIRAAYSSRLNPFALHAEEYQMLKDHICKSHVTAYLNVRNRILRLWERNPLVCVTAEEAAGCASSPRWINLTQVAYEWLVRKGYINFGCVEPLEAVTSRIRRSKKGRRKMIIIIGAGMAGLGCARQLQGLLSHYRDRATSSGEEVPRVIILEGRHRIGGRIYSHPLRNQEPTSIPKGNRCTAELGAHIIVGFDHGNPLSAIIRGQLALPYHSLKDTSTIFDLDGTIVDRKRDTMVEKLYNDILDRASVYRHRIAPAPTFDGNKEMIEAGRDPTGECGTPIGCLGDDGIDQATKDHHNGIENIPRGIDKLTGKAYVSAGSRNKIPPAQAAEAMGWQTAPNVLASTDMNLDAVAKTSKYPTLGAAMDEAVKQYQFLLDLSPQDMRLLNWHYANLEYANAINTSKLSLGGWDQDIGNEFEGSHAQMIGGYQQVPRAIWQSPTQLDVRPQNAVRKISYDPKGTRNSTAKVLCEDGEVYEADEVILTAPLGVIKSGHIAFDPPLPEWKAGPIQRLGFGLLNKVILVFDEPFWDVNQDMFGLLRDADIPDSLDQEDYAANRGKYYFFWNCVKTSGLPVLISLMVGDAAYQTEKTHDNEIVAGVIQELGRMFKRPRIPIPRESIVTRWGQDRFACGTYSYVGATSLPGDYEALAKPVGNLHFAGEATCGTHPATVHGAYISGLRAASEIMEKILGPIEIPEPLVEPVSASEQAETPVFKDSPMVTHANGVSLKESEEVRRKRLDEFEAAILQTIFAEIGYQPSPPGRPGSNPFLLYTADKWAECKRQCDEARQAATKDPRAQAARNEIRAAVGLMWRQTSVEDRRPWTEQTELNRQANAESAATYEERLAAWNQKAVAIRTKYVQEHPGVITADEEKQMWEALGVHNEQTDRKAKKMVDCSL